MVSHDGTAHLDRRSYWNERYSEDPGRFGDEPNQFVVSVLSGLPPGAALDVGCGRGRNAVWLASLGYRVTAVDISDVGIAYGRALAAKRGVEVTWVRTDFDEWDPPSAGFDLVLLSYLHFPPDLRIRTHARAAGALVAGGRLVLVAHHTENLEHGVGGPDDPDVLYNEQILAADFAGLDVERNERVYREVEVDGATVTAIDALFVAGRTGD